jgi:hypothetical protein
MSKAQKSNPIPAKFNEPLKTPSINGKIVQQQPPVSRVSNQYVPVQSGGNNERQVKEMLITLLR